MPVYISDGNVHVSIPTVIVQVSDPGRLHPGSVVQLVVLRLTQLRFLRCVLFSTHNRRSLESELLRVWFTFTGRMLRRKHRHALAPATHPRQPTSSSGDTR